MSLMAQRPKSASTFKELPKYRAPSLDRHSLIEPSLADALRRRVGFHSQPDSKLSQQSAMHSAALRGVSLTGWPLERLRSVARREAIAAAIKYTESYRDLWFDKSDYVARSNDTPWVVAGHQPELFHPGVWFKNFLLSQASQQAAAIPLNLVIDNDLCRAPAIRVLSREAAGSDEAANIHDAGRDSLVQPLFRTESVPFDAPAPPVAWECRSVLDLACFESFPQRVRAALAADVRTPLVDRLWQHALPAARRTGRLGLALAQARHCLEGELGLQTLELPLGQLCHQTSFARFSLAILSDLARFQQIYNAQRTAYRQANGIRSQTHPVPALVARNGWLEAPWWIYREAAPTRRHMFAKLDGDQLLLSDQAGWQATIEGPLDSDDAVADWQQLAIDGVLIRPRALITTMFVRMIISDLFMHGIGGGKYDQLTDAIIGDYFHMPPPEMIVATATLHLPLDNRALGSLAENERAAQREQAGAWRLRYHPETQLDRPDDEMAQLLRTKQELLQSIPPRGEKWEWHRQITRVNERLAELNAAAFQQSQLRLQELAAQQRQLKLALSREFSFCLFELPYVADELTRLAAADFEHRSAK
ncbi:MAG: hypothetical protein IT423_04995 [Pirellulaceae bacterium]|nr:hypothetical protein [Pirellulaceae bacterium]